MRFAGVPGGTDYDLNRRLARAKKKQQNGENIDFDVPYAQLNPHYRGKVGLGNFNAHDAFMDCTQGPGCGGDGYKEAIITWHNAWYLALGLNFTIGFSLLVTGERHYNKANLNNPIASNIYLGCILVAIASSATGIYAVGQSVDNVGFRPANIMSEYGASHSDSFKNCCLVNQRRRGLPMEADFANVSMQALVWSGLALVYLLHGWENCCLAFVMVVWMRWEMYRSQKARIRQNRSLNYLIGRITMEQLMASDTSSETWRAAIPRYISLIFLTSWHNVRLGQPNANDYLDVFAVKELMEDSTDPKRRDVVGYTDV
jgi:hypothetical protein